MSLAGRLADGRSLDRSGAILVCAAVVWMAVTSRSGADPAPMVGIVVAAVLGLVAGRLSTRVARSFGPVVIAIASGVALVVLLAGSVSGTRSQGPLGYSNAVGAYFVQASVAALMVAVTVHRRLHRTMAVGAALAFAAVPFAVGSTAAAVLCLGLPIAIGARSVLGGRRTVWACALLLAAVVLATVLVAAASVGGEGDRRGGFVDDLLSPRRTALWGDAWAIALEHPVTGVGPGRFSQESPTARLDRDTRQAHNEFLQVAAETGFVGLALLILGFAWGFARLLVNRDPDIVVVLGAAGLAALGIHASVDYIWHFAAIPIVAGVLVGAAQAQRPEHGGRNRIDGDVSDGIKIERLVRRET